MTLKESKKFLPLIILALIIVLIMTIVSIFSGKKTPQPSPIPKAPNFIAPYSTSSADLPPKIQEIRKKIIESQILNNYGDILLHQTETYKIEYITSPNVFFVTINKDPAEEAKKDAEAWFLKFGLTQEELCNLPVRFVLGNIEVRQTNLNFSSLPNSCANQ